ncbi:hypothetical protein ACVPOS_06660 [Staphylococcus aureus]
MNKYRRILINTNEVLKAYANGFGHLHTRIGVKYGSLLNSLHLLKEQNKKILATSVGKIIFNEIIPDSFAYIN